MNDLGVVGETDCVIRKQMCDKNVTDSTDGQENVWTMLGERRNILHQVIARRLRHF